MVWLLVVLYTNVYLFVYYILLLSFTAVYICYGDLFLVVTAAEVVELDCLCFGVSVYEQVSAGLLSLEVVTGAIY